MEDGVLVSESPVAVAQLEEVLRGLGHDVLVQLHLQAALGSAADRDADRADGCGEKYNLNDILR